MNTALEQSFRVSEYPHKRELAIQEFERRLSSGEASLPDLRDTIRMLNSEGKVIRALLRQCGMPINR